MTPAVNVATAFVAGLFSFASPCVLPLIPAYLSFLTGTSLEELRAGNHRARLHVLSHALAFCLGFSLVFVVAGLAAGTLGSGLTGQRVWLARIGGICAVVLGLQMLGVLRIGALMADRRLRLQRSERSYPASFLVGVGFAAGWSPCIGPILAGILLLASAESSYQATLLLSAYSLGLALPMLIAAAALGSALGVVRRITPFLRGIEAVAGFVLLSYGVLLITGAFEHSAAFFSHLFPGSEQ